MKTKRGVPSQFGLWRISIAALCLIGTFGLMAQNFSDWSAPVNLGETINTSSQEQTPGISKTGLSLYFASNRAGGSGGLDIWVAQRASLDAPWGTPQNLGSRINSANNDFTPYLPPDGHTLLFNSDRPGGLGQNDLYISHRSNQRDDFGWDFPVNLGSGVNSPSVEVTPGSFEDDNGNFILYFGSNRPGGPGSFDIYTSMMGNDGTFGPAVLVPELSSSGNDSSPIPRRDGLELYLASGRTGSLGVDDLYVSTRASTSNPWSTPVSMGPSINTSANDTAPAIPFSRTSLIFNSNRPGGFGGSDLYVITRTTGTGPAISAGGVVNASTYTAGPLAPNSLVSIFGTNLATVTAPGQLVSGVYGTSLFGTRVSFNFAGGSIGAPLLYISPLQINAQVPAALPAGSASVTVTMDGVTSPPQQVTISTAGAG